MHGFCRRKVKRRNQVEILRGFAASPFEFRQTVISFTGNGNDGNKYLWQRKWVCTTAIKPAESRLPCVLRVKLSNEQHLSFRTWVCPWVWVLVSLCPFISFESDFDKVRVIFEKKSAWRGACLSFGKCAKQAQISQCCQAQVLLSQFINPRRICRFLECFGFCQHVLLLRISLDDFQFSSKKNLARILSCWREKKNYILWNPKWMLTLIFLSLSSGFFRDNFRLHKAAADIEAALAAW